MTIDVDPIETHRIGSGWIDDDRRDGDQFKNDQCDSDQCDSDQCDNDQCDSDQIGDVVRAEPGVIVTDHIENTQFELYTDRPVNPLPGDPDDHYFPVDTATVIETTRLEIPRIAVAKARDETGQFVTRGRAFTLTAGTYHLGLDPTPIKLYLMFDGACSVSTTNERTRVDFNESTSVSIGFRSLQQVPAGTITTPLDPTSLMRAVSYFGSALGTTSPERSFPTLRGHPPMIEAGETFSLPEHVSRPDTGVRIVIPPTYEALYPIVPLAYYLAATVVPGSHARLETDDWQVPLAPDIERRAGEVLRQTFHLDCITRSEGFFPVDLHERAVTSLDLDWAALYEQPLAERLGTYLEVPFAQIESELPQWTLTTDIRPDPENASVLPFVAAELSLVRAPASVAGLNGSGDESCTTAAGGFLRTPTPESADLLRGGASEAVAPTTSTPEPTRGSTSRSTDPFVPDDTRFVRPNPVETVEHAWVGDGIPIGANKATPEGYERRLAVGPVEQSRISVSVVCNDEQMREEGAVGDLYGLRDIVQFDIDVSYDRTRSEMRSALAADVDFLHYIGHVDERGMQCADGYLDLTAEDLDIGVSAFLLNACQSYEQGKSLIDRGSRGGIVSLTDVANSSATRLGRIIARLMNSGFNLRTALHVAKRELVTGRQYLVVGDGGTTVCQSRSGVAVVVQIETTGDEQWRLTAEVFPNGPYGVGTLTYLNRICENENHYTPARITAETVNRSACSELFELETAPIFVDGTLRWTDESWMD